MKGRNDARLAHGEEEVESLSVLKKFNRPIFSLNVPRNKTGRDIIF